MTTDETSTDETATKVVTASREIAAPTEVIFELIADPRRQPEWDGNDNLAGYVDGQRVHDVGDVFTIELTNGKRRDNRVVAFEEGRVIAWRPFVEYEPGHEWRWEIEPIGDAAARVTHVYDWRDLTDETRIPRARATTSENLRASLDRLADAAESTAGSD